MTAASRLTAGLSQAPPKEWIDAHRRVWATKPVLRAVYQRWFQLLRERAAAGRIVEIGCGPGFFKAAYGDVIATDVTANPYADCILDAAVLPFAAGSLGSIVMIDVFHHLPEPERFLREAERVLRPGGRIVLVEPWIGVAGRLFWTYLHHEDCDPSVPPEAPWRGPSKDPMQGNAALPYLYFGAGGHAERLGLALRVTERQAFAGLPWLLSGGFQPFSLFPAALGGAVERVDRLLSRLPRWTATRCLITLERSA